VALSKTDLGMVPMAVRRLQIDFNQFEYAIAAADYGSFRQAAEALSIKQSTISRSVQMLEHELGAQIFKRSRRGVRATSIGRQFLRIARSVVEQLDALAMMTRASGQGKIGRLSVGFCTSLTKGNWRALMLDFKSKFPGGRTRNRRAIKGSACYGAS
jgi:DNA-binding transcriptional LysR family regulator